MLKRSLLAVAILGVFVAAAGAHSEGEVEKAKDLQTPDVEFVFEAPPATCEAAASEVPSEAWFEDLLNQQGVSRLDDGEVEVAWGRRSRCFVCTPYLCYLVWC